jgi:hypothetical protein
MNSIRGVRGVAAGVAIFVLAGALCAACGTTGASTGGNLTTSTSVSGTAPTSTLPPGVMSADRACRLVVGRSSPRFFTDVEQVHLVLTTYAKGEPVESEGDINQAMPPDTLVWVVEVHAKAINWDHSVPPGYKAPAHPDTDYSVVMNAQTGIGTDSGECRCWPLPLSQVGTLVSLPADC